MLHPEYYPGKNDGATIQTLRQALESIRKAVQEMDHAEFGQANMDVVSDQLRRYLGESSKVYQSFSSIQLGRADQTFRKQEAANLLRAAHKLLFENGLYEDYSVQLAKLNIKEAKNKTRTTITTAAIAAILGAGLSLFGSIYTSSINAKNEKSKFDTEQKLLFEKELADKLTLNVISLKETIRTELSFTFNAFARSKDLDKALRDSVYHLHKKSQNEYEYRMTRASLSLSYYGDSILLHEFSQINSRGDTLYQVLYMSLTNESVKDTYYGAVTALNMSDSLENIYQRFMKQFHSKILE